MPKLACRRNSPFPTGNVHGAAPGQPDHMAHPHGTCTGEPPRGCGRVPRHQRPTEPSQAACPPALRQMPASALPASDACPNSGPGCFGKPCTPRPAPPRSHVHVRARARPPVTVPRSRRHAARVHAPRIPWQGAPNPLGNQPARKRSVFRGAPQQPAPVCEPHPGCGTPDPAPPSGVPQGPRHARAKCLLWRHRVFHQAPPRGAQRPPRGMPPPRHHTGGWCHAHRGGGGGPNEWPDPAAPHLKPGLFSPALRLR